MSLADELLADLEEIGDEPDDEEQNQVHVHLWLYISVHNYVNVQGIVIPNQNTAKCLMCPMSS